MKCPYCNEEIKDNSLYCQFCGNIIDKDESNTEEINNDEEIISEKDDRRQTEKDLGFILTESAKNYYREIFRRYKSRDYRAAKKMFKTIMDKIMAIYFILVVIAAIILFVMLENYHKFTVQTFFVFYFFMIFSVFAVLTTSEIVRYLKISSMVKKLHLDYEKAFFSEIKPKFIEYILFYCCLIAIFSGTFLFLYIKK